MTGLRLAEMKPGQQAKITGYQEGGKEYRKKFLSFGLTVGTEIELKKATQITLESVCASAIKSSKKRERLSSCRAMI